MNWIQNCSKEVRERLRNCTTRREDLPDLLEAKWKAMKEQGKDKEGFTKEDALVDILELLDCNGRFIDLTKEEYLDLIA